MLANQLRELNKEKPQRSKQTCATVEFIWNLFGIFFPFGVKKMDFDSMKYADLRQLAKSVGLKANMKVRRLMMYSFIVGKRVVLVLATAANVICRFLSSARNMCIISVCDITDANY